MIRTECSLELNGSRSNRPLWPKFDEQKKGKNHLGRVMIEERKTTLVWKVLVGDSSRTQGGLKNWKMNVTICDVIGGALGASLKKKKDAAVREAEESAFKGKRVGQYRAIVRRREGRLDIEKSPWLESREWNRKSARKRERNRAHTSAAADVARAGEDKRWNRGSVKREGARWAQSEIERAAEQSARRCCSSTSKWKSFRDSRG